MFHTIKVNKIKIVKSQDSDRLERKVNEAIEEGWFFDSFHSKTISGSSNHCILLKEVEIDKEI